MRRSALLLLMVLPLPVLAQEPTHPLDELTVAEYWAVYETLRAHIDVEEGAEFLYAGLNEPTKAEVLAWRPGRPFGRQARVHLVQSHTGYEAVVDVVNRAVLEFREVTDRQYMWAPMDPCRPGRDHGAPGHGGRLRGPGNHGLEQGRVRRLV